MSGAYCKKHEEYNHSGVCRWCEPADAFEIGKPLAIPISLTGKPGVPFLPAATATAPSLSCGSYGFPSAELDMWRRANPQPPFGMCKCSLGLLALDHIPWIDEKGVRHAPSGCQ